MRLLDTETGQFIDKDPEDEKTVYAILSYTWDTEKGEQTYKELKKIQRRYGPTPPLPNQHSGPGGLEGGVSFSPRHDRCGPSFTPSCSTQLLSDSASVTTTPSKAIGRLTQSEVEDLFRAFVQTYGVASSTPAAAVSVWDDPELSPKIRDACRVARENGYRYIWIDSCCIDKSSSSELSEAINSMYKWYGLAAVCYAYLADVPPGDNHQAEGSAFRKSRWFRRGWTLQELIAPDIVEFLSKDWTPVASKHALVYLVKNVTNINEKALLHSEPLDAFSVAQRLSWAAERETTRVEDRAYSLLGIFDINMPTLYGEGDRAFQRLQEQIMQRIPDQSLFAWGEVYVPARQLAQNTIPAQNPITLTAQRRGYISAWSPNNFQNSRNIRHVQLPASHRHEIVYTLTSYGIRAQFRMIPLTGDLLSAILPHSAIELQLPHDSHWYLAILGCEHMDHPRRLLARVCYIPPSESGVDSIYAGFINFGTTEDGVSQPDLFLLSPETIEDYRQHSELKTVYIPHHDRAILRSTLRFHPYAAIKLVLLRETRDALRSRGYAARLRNPNPARPTTHRLTLSKDGQTIIVELQHTLKDDGGRFAIDAEVKMLGLFIAQRDSTPGGSSDQAENHTRASWFDTMVVYGWRTQLDRKSVGLSVAGLGTLTVDLGLDFAGNGVYFLRVDVLNDASPASSVVERAVDGAEQGGLYGAIDITEEGREDLGEAGGRETVPSAEARDALAVGISDDTEGGDGVLA